jgi:uncharacterized membrane protein
MKLSILASLALITAASAVPALAQTSAGGGQVVIRVCNNSDDAARVALSYQPVGSNIFYNEGWFGVGARQCENLRTTENAFFYGYAEVENDGGRYWSGDFPLCVQYPGPYAFWTYGSQCEAGQELRQFVTMQAQNFGEYVWTLEPP